MVAEISCRAHRLLDIQRLRVEAAQGGGRREQACTAPCTRIAARRTRLAESPSRIIYASGKLPSPIDASKSEGFSTVLYSSVSQRDKFG